MEFKKSATMKKNKVYILYIQSYASTDYTIFCATTDVQKILAFCSENRIDLDYEATNGSELTKEIIENESHIEINDLIEGYSIIDSFEVNLPKSRRMYGVIGNGSDFNAWVAIMKGLYPTHEKAIKAILSEISKYEWELEKLEDYQERLNEYNSIIDGDSTYWDIVEISIE